MTDPVIMRFFTFSLSGIFIIPHLGMTLLLDIEFLITFYPLILLLCHPTTF
jgi:hypothetical protein